MLPVTLTTKQIAEVVMSPKNPDEQPVDVTGKPIWTAQGNPSSGALSIPISSHDGLSAKIPAASMPGITDIWVQANTKQGPVIIDAIRVTVVEAAYTMGLSVKSITQKP